MKRFWGILVVGFLLNSPAFAEPEAIVTPSADTEMITEIHARHILVEDEAGARDLKKQLEGGADFAALARKHSIGPSKSYGGDLGFFRKGQMVPEFEKTAFNLAVGEYAVFQTQFGWHVIEVLERRQVEVQAPRPPAIGIIPDSVANLDDLTKLDQDDVDSLKKAYNEFSTSFYKNFRMFFKTILEKSEAGMPITLEYTEASISTAELYALIYALNDLIRKKIEAEVEPLQKQRDAELKPFREKYSGKSIITNEDKKEIDSIDSKYKNLYDEIKKKYALRDQISLKFNYTNYVSVGNIAEIATYGGERLIKINDASAYYQQRLKTVIAGLSYLYHGYPWESGRTVQQAKDAFFQSLFELFLGRVMGKDQQQVKTFDELGDAVDFPVPKLTVEDGMVKLDPAPPMLKSVLPTTTPENQAEADSLTDDEIEAFMAVARGNHAEEKFKALFGTLDKDYSDEDNARKLIEVIKSFEVGLKGYSVEDMQSENFSNGFVKDLVGRIVKIHPEALKWLEGDVDMAVTTSTDKKIIKLNFDDVEVRTEYSASFDVLENELKKRNYAAVTKAVNRNAPQEDEFANPKVAERLQEISLGQMSGKIEGLGTGLAPTVEAFKKDWPSYKYGWMMTSVIKQDEKAAAERCVKKFKADEGLDKMLQRPRDGYSAVMVTRADSMYKKGEADPLMTRKKHYCGVVLNIGEE